MPLTHWYCVGRAGFWVALALVSEAALVRSGGADGPFLADVAARLAHRRTHDVSTRDLLITWQANVDIAADVVVGYLGQCLQKELEY